MNLSKSEPKIKKISLDKYENFFSNKNWKQQMYMDLENEQKPALNNSMKNIRKGQIVPKAKLTQSLHDKVGLVLNNSRKKGLLESIPSTQTRRSITKIASQSSKFPESNESKELQTHLYKIKNKLNQYGKKNLQIEKMKYKKQASLNLIKQHISMYEDILNSNGGQTQEHLKKIQQQTQASKYQNQIKKHMVQTLKSANITYSYRKKCLQKRLSNLKISYNSIVKDLEHRKTIEASNKQIKKQFEGHQKNRSSLMENKSMIAQTKITLKNKAQQLKSRLENLEEYSQQQYNYETDSKIHNKCLKQVYAQKATGKMLDCFYRKQQEKQKQFQKAYILIRMHSIFNRNQENFKLQFNPSSADDEEFNVGKVYQESFTIKKIIQEKISESEKKINQLEKQRQKLLNKWMKKVHEDSLKLGEKEQPAKDHSKAIKKLVQKQQLIDRQKQINIWIQFWIKKQTQKLNLKISKKNSPGEYIQQILTFIKKQVKDTFEAKKADSSKNSEVKKKKK